MPEALNRLERNHVAAGLALGLDTPIEAVVPYLDRIALVTMMGTRIGIKGQELAEQACPRIRVLRHVLHTYGYADTIKIAANGGIREQTVPALRAAGAERLLWDRWPTTVPILTRHFAGSGRYQSRCRSEAVAFRSLLHRQQQRPQGVKGALR